MIGRHFVLIRYPLGWAGLVAALLLTAAGMVAVHLHVPGAGERWAADLGILTLTAAAAGRLLPALVWFPAMAPPSHAVADVMHGGESVGRAARVRHRLVITSATAVSRALDRPSGMLQAAPGRREQVRLRFESQPGAAVWARVVLWGPARPGLRCPDVAVLRTVSWPPRRTGRLPVSRGTHDGAAMPVTASADAPGVSVHDHRLTTDGPLPAGTPLVASLPDDPPADIVGREIVALVAPDDAVVDAGDLRRVLGDVTRRTVLRAGAGAAAMIAVGGAGTAGYVRYKQPPPVPGPPTLTGAGWQELFVHPAVKDHLKANNLLVGEVREVSGVDSLSLPLEVLSGLSFVTCPNLAVANAMKEKLTAAPREAFQQYQICSEELVILMHGDRLPGLIRAKVLAYPRDEPEARPIFDMRRYLMQYRSTSGAVDQGTAAPGDEIRISYSDPLRAGAGQMFLALLVSVHEELVEEGRFDRADSWLWSENGPIWGESEPRTRILINNLKSGQADMICTYEHDAVRFLKEEEGKGYVLVRTSPFAAFNQYFLSLTAEALKLGRLLETNDKLRETLRDNLYLRSGDDREPSDTWVRGELLGAAVTATAMTVATSDAAKRPIQIPHMARMTELLDAVRAVQHPTPGPR